ncbi:hypothetical protein OTU49_017532 [Cherax quadricarinatus]|uniref:C2H2-type domain-containing protein n=2 Tax=Cherax quadricarinatus TaxID=27406 RepID=A0AAW0YS54_CHEQU
MLGSEDTNGRRYSHAPHTTHNDVADEQYGTRTVMGSGQGHRCTHCGREFRSRSNLSRHVRDHHTAHDPSAALCPVCGKNCRNRSNVLTHMYRVHHVTARQLDAFTHPITLPHVRPDPPTDAHPPTQPAHHPHSQAHGHNPREYTHNTNAHLTYGYNMQESCQQQQHNTTTSTT